MSESTEEVIPVNVFAGNVPPNGPKRLSERPESPLDSPRNSDRSSHASADDDEYKQIPFSRKVRYVDHSDESIFELELKDPYVGERYVQGPSSARFSAKATIELVTEVRTTQTKSDRDKGAKDTPPMQVVLGNKLVINSRGIINALNTIIKYYPENNLTGDSAEIAEPYAILVHYEEEITQLRNDHAPENIGSKQICEYQQNIYDDLSILQDVINGQMSEMISAERRRHERGVCTFSMLWLLLKPGTDCFIDPPDDGHWCGFVIRTVDGGMVERKPTVYELGVWSLHYNAERVGRRLQVAEIVPFEGEKAISSLNVIPAAYFDKPDQRERLEKRGELYYRLTQKTPMWYSGLTVTFPKRHYEGMVIVDQQEYFIMESHEPRPNLLLEESGQSAGVMDCACPVCVSKQKDVSIRAKFSEYDQLLDIENCSEPVYDVKLMNQIVMSEDRRRLLANLSRSYIRENVDGTRMDAKPWAASSVKGKNSGIVILLHGKPGVGKTYTAECVAEFTRRPLLSLSCADIGTDALTVEGNLTKFFKRGKHWGAVILIDEADIYMERRVNQDLKRNALVAGFLRALEYYDGILFLTTNRVGTFDDAFISRMHVSLYYSDFSDEDRKLVWQSFFDKLAKEREDDIRIPIDTREYVEGREVRELKWNGREIGNAFQTAVALAEVENEKDKNGRILVKESHIRQIVQMSRDFTRYLTELHIGDESKRAQRASDRLDDFKAV